MKRKRLNWARSYADVADEVWSFIIYTDEAHPKKFYSFDIWGITDVIFIDGRLNDRL